MDNIEKTDRNQSQSLILHGFCLTVFFVLYYINYNMPIFAQIFAHYTYLPVKLEDSKEPLEYNNKYSFCLREPWYWEWDQNSEYCGQTIPRHTYKVNGIEYTLKLTTYTFDRPHRLSKTAFFTPLYPAWSVADNRFPGGSYWQSFVYQTAFLCFWITSYFLLSARMLGSTPRYVLRIVNLQSKKMSLENSVILSGYIIVFMTIVVAITYRTTGLNELIKTQDADISAAIMYVRDYLPYLFGVIVFALYAPLRYLILAPGIGVYLSQMSNYAFVLCPLALIIHISVVLLGVAINSLKRRLNPPKQPPPGNTSRQA